jgi:hypothetical protein
VSRQGPTTAEPPRRGSEPAPLRCPRCGAQVAPQQDWCLECGAPARTRLAPTPNWRLPIAIIAAIVVAAGIALALAFVALTGDDGPVATTTAPAPAQPTATSPTQTVPTPPAATTTTPAATPTNPAATTPAATTPAGTTPTTPATTGATPTTPGR